MSWRQHRLIGRWSLVDVHNLGMVVATERKALRPHQELALGKVLAGFGVSDRGRLVMACGTGKTLTSLRIAEGLVGTEGSVLFLAPSIALVSQSLKEWTAERIVPLRPFAICSDATAAKSVDGEIGSPYDVAIAPTTDVDALVRARAGQGSEDRLTVVFSTYQSIGVVQELQVRTGLVFDLVVCDEAHRTAGITGTDDDSSFVAVHDNSLLPAAKRLYMTATPK